MHYTKKNFEFRTQIRNKIWLGFCVFQTYHGCTVFYIGIAQWIFLFILRVPNTTQNSWTRNDENAEQTLMINKTTKSFSLWHILTVRRQIVYSLSLTSHMKRKCHKAYWNAYTPHTLTDTSTRELRDWVTSLKGKFANFLPYTRWRHLVKNKQKFHTVVLR